MKIAIIDDAKLTVSGIRLCLAAEEDMEVVHVAYDIDTFLQYLRNTDPSLHPDVVLLDISLKKETDGLDLAAMLHTKYPAIRVIILSHHKRSDFLATSIQYGVRGYAAKDTEPSEIPGIIRLVMSGSSFYFGDTIPEKARLAATRGSEQKRKVASEKFSDRELLILRMTSQGYTSKEIATFFHIAPSSVDSYKERIKNKIGANSLIEAVVMAVKQGIA